MPVTEAVALNVHGEGHSQAQQPGGQDEGVGEGVAGGDVAGWSEDGQEPVSTDPDHVVKGNRAEGDVEGDDDLEEYK